MKTAVISTMTYSTPPTGYGGEIFWWDLACAFSELGHNVTLYAPSGSRVPPGGKLRYLPCTRGEFDAGAETVVAEWYMEEILQHDFILECSHSRFLSEGIFCFYPEHKHKVFNVLNGVSVPRIPYNIVVGSQKWRDLMEAGDTQFKDTPWESMYGKHNQPLNNGEIIGNIWWATNTQFYTPGDGNKEDYLLWMARPSPYKGLHRALKLAAELNLQLKIVAPVMMAEHALYSGGYQEVIAFAREKCPHIEVVQLPNNGDHHTLKREIYRKARALLVTMEAHEPFGLTLIEALSCGTPVIAGNVGAFPEIIRQGETGFLCNTDDDFGDAIKHIEDISPEHCRLDALERWDRTRAGREYIDLFEEQRSTVSFQGVRDQNGELPR